MKGIRLPVLVASLLTVAGCNDLVVPDLNNPSLDDLVSNPTPTKIAAAAQGLMIGARAGMGAQNGYVSLLGILGRESYNFDPADPRFITEMLIGPLDGGSPAFGANLWANPYQNIRNANILLAALDVVSGISDPAKEAARGYAKTIQALDFLQVIVTRDTNGAPIDVDRPPTGDPAPVMPREDVYAHIVQLLDEADAHLAAAGAAAFPFELSEGFTGFATPATFRLFNRALKARVEVYRGSLALAACGAGGATCFTSALTALGASFIDTAASASLRLGVYHAFSTGSGDVTNAIFDPDGRAILAHPSIETDAQLQAGGALDQRYLDKVTTTTPRTVQGITTDQLFTIYNTNEDPVPIIRNEELILLRAEANLGLGNLVDVVTDINTIRVRSGGLPLYTGAVTAAALETELLYNKRYSLLFEGGHRWIDLRRYGRLADVSLDLGMHTRQAAFPFPDAECLARGSPNIPGC